jgi:hypothetical protein
MLVGFKWPFSVTFSMKDEYDTKIFKVHTFNLISNSLLCHSFNILNVTWQTKQWNIINKTYLKQTKS